MPDTLAAVRVLAAGAGPAAFDALQAAVAAARAIARLAEDAPPVGGRRLEGSAGRSAAVRGGEASAE